MPSPIRFRNCVHHARTDRSIASILAAIRGECCDFRPASRAVDAGTIYQRVERCIGRDRLTSLWRGYRGGASTGDPRGFAEYLGHQEEGRSTPAIADLARLDLALYLAGMSDQEPSIAACCLPVQLASSQDRTVLRLQPSFRYLPLRFAIHEWQDGPLPKDPEAQRVLLRLSPGKTETRREILPAGRFSFESSLARGFTVAKARSAARRHQEPFEEIAAILDLAAAGAIAEIILQPKGAML